MPKIITSRRRESTHDKALEYVKTHILLPSGLLGLIFMVSGMASLAYQFVAMNYDGQTFLESFGLLAMGAILGWAQTRYHRHVLQEDPGYFAERMRFYSKTGSKRLRKETVTLPIQRERSRFLPLYYLLGITLLVGASFWSSIVGQTYYVAAFLMPWAGFFWAKMFFWRKILEAEAGKR